MSLMIIGKLFVGGAIATAGSIAVGLNWDKIIGAPWRSVVVYAKISEQETSNPLTKTNIVTTDDAKNYKCRFNKESEQQEEHALFECNIQQLKDPTPSKNQIYYDEFEGSVSGEKVLEKDKIFQIIFKTNKHDWKHDGTNKIEIVSTDDGEDKGKKYGTADVWFVFDKDKEIKATQFIGQYTTSTAAGTLLSDYKCSWKDEVKSESCQVYSFSADSQVTDKEYLTLTFKNENSQATEIKEHHHYRIVWNTPAEAKDKINITIFAKATKSAVDTTSEETIKFEKVKPSFLVGDKIVVIKDKPSS